MIPGMLSNALDWAQNAACQGFGLDAFFTESKAGIAAAKQVCDRCPVQPQCLTEALCAEDATRYGIYGGLTPAERAELGGEEQRVTAEEPTPPPAKRKTGRKPAPCGTRSAYQRHVKNREPIDEPCRAANTAADRRLRSTGSTKART